MVWPFVAVLSATAVVLVAGAGMPNEKWVRPVTLNAAADAVDAALNAPNPTAPLPAVTAEGVYESQSVPTRAPADVWDVTEPRSGGPVPMYAHPAAPQTHIQPAYAAQYAPDATRYPDALRVPGSPLWRAFVGHPRDGSPFRPLYVDKTHQTVLSRAPAAAPAYASPLPTVLPPFLRPERMIGSHFPALPDEPCVCAFRVSDPRLCTKWVASPLYECVKRQGKKCFKYAAAPVRHTCPCVHADKNRKCYFWAPPGTRAQDYPQRDWAQSQPQPQPQSQPPQPPQRPQQPQPQAVGPSVRPDSAPKTPSNVRVPTVQPVQPSQVPQPQVPAVVPAQSPAQKPAQQPAQPAVVSPTSSAAATRNRDAQSRAAAVAMKEKVRRAKVEAAQRAMDARVKAFRESAIARYTAKHKANVARAQKQRNARRRAAAAQQARERGWTPVARTTGALVVPTKTQGLNGRVEVRNNGNARPQSAVVVAATEFDKDVFARTLYGEALHDDEPGQRAVAWALINRARDPHHRFPKTLADVCRQKGQFRTWAKPALTKRANALDKHSPAYRAMRRVVDHALAGRSVDPTAGAHFYYYNGRVAPQWAADMDCSFRSKVHTFCHAKREAQRATA